MGSEINGDRASHRIGYRFSQRRRLGLIGSKPSDEHLLQLGAFFLQMSIASTQS